MKKILFSLLILSSFSFAIEYYAKIEPINTYEIKSSVSGKVEFVNKDYEAKNTKNTLVLKLDDKVNKIDLKQAKLKLKNQKEILKIEKSTLQKFKRISSKSQFDRDNQKIKILNMSSSISDLETRIATLEDMIKNKNLYENNSYLYDIAVEVGDYVNPGNLLYTAMDLNKGKLEIFIPISDIQNIKEKSIYLDGVKTDLNISKIYSVADTKHISSYKVEIIIPKPKQFSKLIKVQFK